MYFRLSCLFILLMLLPIMTSGDELNSNENADSLLYEPSHSESQVGDNSGFVSNYLSSQRTELSNDLPLVFPTLLSDYIAIHKEVIPRTKRDVLRAAGVLTVGGLFIGYDQQIYDALGRNSDHWTLKSINDVGDVVEKTGLKAVMYKYYFSALAVGYLTDNDFLKNTTLDILESSFIATSVQLGMKYSTGRARPDEGLGAFEFKPPEYDAFFSGHSANVTQLAVILSHHVNYKPFTYAAFAAAGTVCVQRVLSERHWPSDVFFGVVWGWIVANGVIDRNDKPVQLGTVSNQHMDGISLTLHL